MNPKKVLLTTSALTCAMNMTTQRAQSQEIYNLGEIVVSATTVPTERGRTGSSIEVLTEDELSTSNGILLTDELIRLPGVSKVQNGPAGTSSNIRIRGAEEKFTAVYVDGIKVNDPSSTGGQFGNFGAFSSGALSRVEVLKGSQSALYGAAAVSGVVNIFTLNLDNASEGTTQQAEFLVGSYDTYSANYALTRKTGPLTLAFAASHFITDGFSAADEDDGNTEDDGARESRMSFGAAYEVTETATVGFNAFWEDGRSDFDEFGPIDGTPGDELNDRNAKGARAFMKFELGGWSHDAQLTYYEVERNLSSDGLYSSFESNFEADRVRFEYSASKRIMDQLAISTGLDTQKETAEYENLSEGSEDTRSTGAFVEATYSPSSDLDIITTLRTDDHSEFGRENTGRLAFSYRPRAGLTLRGAAATGYRPPAIDELYGDYYDPCYPFFGNEDLNPETSKSIEIGADYEWSDTAGMSLTLFRNEIEDLIKIVSYPVVPPPNECEYSEDYTLVNIPGKSVYKGIELGGYVDLTDRLSLIGAYTYIDAKENDGSRLVRVPRHDLSIGLNAEITDRFSANLNIRHVADRTAEGFPQKEKPDDYTTVDLTFFYDLTDSAEAFVRIENLTDESYQTIPGYGTSDRAVYIGVRATF